MKQHVWLSAQQRPDVLGLEEGTRLNPPLSENDYMNIN